MPANWKSGPIAIGLLLLTIAASFALIAGVLVGHQKRVDSDIDSGIQRVLSRDVPGGVLDEEEGSYRGVALGDPEESVIRKLGRPNRQGPREAAIPDVIEGSVYAGHGSWSCGGQSFKTLAYPEVALTIEDGRVCTISVAGNGWSTTGGVSAGDSIEVLKDRFGDSACSESFLDDPFYEQWQCEARLPSGIRIHFGADPLTSVEIFRPRKSW